MHDKQRNGTFCCSKRRLQCLDLLKDYGIDVSKSEAANGRTFVNAALKGDINGMEWLLNTDEHSELLWLECSIHDSSI